MGKEEYAEQRLLEGMDNPLARQMHNANNLYYLTHQYVKRLPAVSKAQQQPLLELKDRLSVQLKTVEERAAVLLAEGGLTDYEQSVLEAVAAACKASETEKGSWHGPTAFIHHLPTRLGAWLGQARQLPKDDRREKGLRGLMKEAAFSFVSSTDIYDALRMPSDEESEKSFSEKSRNDQPLFPPGTYVRINSKDELYYYNDGRVRRRFEVNSYNALVAEAYREEGGQPFYSVVFDITAMRLMPKDYIREEVSNFELLEFVEEELLSAERRRRSPYLADMIVVSRELRYTLGLKSMDHRQRVRLEKILLRQAADTDEQNWLHHFKTHLPFPQGLRARGELDEWEAGQEVVLLGYLGYSRQYGLVVHAQSGKTHRYTPLAEFYASEGPLKELLDDYYAWFEHIL